VRWRSRGPVLVSWRSSCELAGCGSDMRRWYLRPHPSKGEGRGGVGWTWVTWVTWRGSALPVKWVSWQVAGWYSPPSPCFRSRPRRRPRVHPGVRCLGPRPRPCCDVVGIPLPIVVRSARKWGGDNGGLTGGSPLALASSLGVGARVVVVVGRKKPVRQRLARCFRFGWGRAAGSRGWDIIS